MRMATFGLLFFCLLQSPAAQAAEAFEKDAAVSVTLANSLVEVTGVAISPLVVFSGLGAWTWFRHPESRGALPWHAEPWVWGPLFALLLMLFFKEAILGRFVLLKKPFDLVELLIDKAGALVLAPWVVSRAIEAFREPATRTVASLGEWLLPSAQAAEGTAATFGFLATTLGLVLSAIAGLLVYGVVFVASHAFNVLLLLSPFGFIDNAIHSMRLGLIGALGAASAIHPLLGAAMALGLVLIAAFIAGWSMRLLIFGSVFSLEFLLGLQDEKHDEGLSAFSAADTPHLPVRTFGRLRRGPEGVVFEHRPWLLLPPRSRPVKGARLQIASGLISPTLVSVEPEGVKTLYRLPPCYNGLEPSLAEALGGLEVVDGSMSASVRRWWQSVSGLA